MVQFNFSEGLPLALPSWYEKTGLILSKYKSERKGPTLNYAKLIVEAAKNKQTLENANLLIKALQSIDSLEKQALEFLKNAVVKSETYAFGNVRCDYCGNFCFTCFFECNCQSPVKMKLCAAHMNSFCEHSDKKRAIVLKDSPNITELLEHLKEQVESEMKKEEEIIEANNDQISKIEVIDLEQNSQEKEKMEQSEVMKEQMGEYDPSLSILDQVLMELNAQEVMEERKKGEAIDLRVQTLPFDRKRAVDEEIDAETYRKMARASGAFFIGDICFASNRSPFVTLSSLQSGTVGAKEQGEDEESKVDESEVVETPENSDSESELKWGPISSNNDALEARKLVEETLEKRKFVYNYSWPRELIVLVKKLCRVYSRSEIANFIKVTLSTIANLLKKKL